LRFTTSVCASSLALTKADFQELHDTLYTNIKLVPMDQENLDVTLHTSLKVSIPLSGGFLGIYVLTDMNKWALPVPIEKLGAHVEAFIETLPAITALRLCRQFGTGPQCFINRLPVELLKTVESFVVEPARESALHTWKKACRCWELKCDIIEDHYPCEESHDIYHNNHFNFYGSRRDQEECFIGDCAFTQDVDAATAAHNRAKMLYIVQYLEWTSKHRDNNEL
jgi:hypothetical protein